MARKFKINDRVRIIATGEIGTVKGREVIPVEGTKRIKIEYVVKVGEGFNNWKSYNKHDLEKVVNEDNPKNEYTAVYDVVDGYKITMYAKVTNEKNLFVKERVLVMGYAIYRPEDEFDRKRGIRIARHRSRKTPFCYMYSDFNGEFNKETVEAIMDVKANYIKNNFDRFINRSK